MLPQEGTMDMEHLQERTGIEHPAQNPIIEAGTTRTEAGSHDSAASSTGVNTGANMPRGQGILPEGTLQLLQELADLPAQLLPPETVLHLKNAGRETLLAVYSLWRNVNRATQGTSSEKIRKHIEVE